MRKGFLLGVIFIMFSVVLMGQIATNEIPRSLRWKGTLDDVSFMKMNDFNLDSLRAEDEILDQHKDIPYRFGHNFDVDIRPDNSGVITYNSRGDKLWRVGIVSHGAVSLNLMLNQFILPKGAELYLYTPRYEYMAGAFTSTNNKDWKSLATDMLPGDTLIVEYFEPANAEFQGLVSIGRVTHGYRSVMDFGDSGACNNNVNCPEGAAWQTEKRSVLLIIVGGNSACTGALINNTAQDGTPYFLTADHCLGGSVANWVFRFNYESPGCANVNGPTNQSVSGAILRANNSGSDFALLELSSNPPVSYNPFFAGWSRSTTTPPSSVAIHHPSGDIKKISFENDPLLITNWGGADCWHVQDWEDGTTEPGSSGSPLFDDQHRIIGQLYGGQASCSFNFNDYYGRFSTSWNGSSSSNRLSDWLDPTGSNLMALGGYPSFSRDLQLVDIVGVEPTLCGLQATVGFAIGNFGSDTLNSTTLTYELNGGTPVVVPYNSQLLPVQTDTLNGIPLTFNPGPNTLIVYTGGFNGQSDQNTSNDTIVLNINAVGTPAYATLDITTDDYGSETTWEVKDGTGNVLYSGGPYTDVNGGQQFSYDFCLEPGCYDLVVYDSYGDGMCCGYGNGGFDVSDNNGQSLASGGSFTTQVTNNFCVNPCAASVTPTISEDGDQLSTVAGNYTYQWFFNGNPITGSNSPSITVIQNGDYTVQITDTAGCIATSQIYTYSSVGLNELSFVTSLFPNPTKDGINITFNSMYSGSYQVTDLRGAVVSSGRIHDQERIRISTRNLSPGAYIIVLELGNYRVNKRFEVLK
jgi:hypothetical protein